MPLDTSIPLQVAAPQNPLQALQGSAGLLNNLLQGRALGQQIQANQAASNAFKEATDPTTGQTDYGKVSAILSQGPGAYNLPQIQGQILDQQKKRQDLTASQWELAYKQNDSVRQALGGLLATPNFTQDDVLRTANGLISSGAISRDQAMQAFASMPNDPAQLRNWVIQHAAAADKGAQLIAAIKPQVQTIDTGGQVNIVPLNPMTGAPVGQVTTLQKNLTPEAAAQRVQTFQNGQPGSVPMGSLVPGTPGYAAAPGGNGGQGGFLPTGPAMGVQAGADVAGKNSAEAANALASTAEGAPTRIYQLQTALQALQGIKTGPGQEQWNQFKTAVSNLPGVGGVIDTSKVKDFDEFKKVMTQYALQQSGAAGAGTDAKLAAAISGNPNAGISGLANDQILRMNIGLESLQQAKNQAWQQSGMQPSDYQKWSAQWNANVDPRVFVASQMSDGDLQKMYKGLSPADKQKFNQTWAIAEKAGWLTPPTSLPPKQGVPQ